MNRSYASSRLFYAANPVRSRSPEWDFGVHWIEGDRIVGPRFRVSWVVLTGEVVAVNLWTDQVIVMATIPAVGEYPWGDVHAWGAFKDAQTIERVMEGWADEPQRKLAWVRERLAAHRQEVAA